MMTGLVVLKIVLMPSRHALGELGEFRAAVVDDRRVHRPQHAVGQRRRAGNLQEMAPDDARGILGHRQRS